MKKDLSESPELVTTVNKVACMLIVATEDAGYANPKLQSDLIVDDGRVYRLTFERIDLDTSKCDHAAK